LIIVKLTIKILFVISSKRLISNYPDNCPTTWWYLQRSRVSS